MKASGQRRCPRRSASTSCLPSWHSRRLCADASGRCARRHSPDCGPGCPWPRALRATSSARRGIFRTPSSRRPLLCRPSPQHPFQDICPPAVLYHVQRVSGKRIVQYPCPDVAAVEVNRHLVGCSVLALRIMAAMVAAGEPRDIPSLCIMLYAVPEESGIPCCVVRSAIILNGMRHA